MSILRDILDEAMTNKELTEIENVLKYLRRRKIEVDVEAHRATHHPKYTQSLHRRVKKINIALGVLMTERDRLKRLERSTK